jgi:hypothetical protein
MENMIISAPPPPQEAIIALPVAQPETNWGPKTPKSLEGHTEFGEDKINSALKRVVDRLTLTAPRESDADKIALWTMIRLLEQAFWAGVGTERERILEFARQAEKEPEPGPVSAFCERLAEWK